MINRLSRITLLGLALAVVATAATVTTTAFSTPRYLYVLDAVASAPSQSTQDVQSGQLSSDEQTFVRSAYARGLFAIGAGQVMFESSQIQEVRMLAAHILRQHVRIDERLASLAKAKGMAALPDKLDANSKEALETLLEAAADDDFELRYCAMVVASSLRDIRTFQGQAVIATDPDLRRLAAEIAADLKQHLAIALVIQRALASALDDSTVTITV